MAYGHQYINEFKQFGVISYTLRLIDDEGVMPNVTIPVVIQESMLNDEHLTNVASSLRNLHTRRYLESLIPVIEEPQVTLTDSLSPEADVILIDDLSPEADVVTFDDLTPELDVVTFDDLSPEADVILIDDLSTESQAQPETPIEII
jgi:hypothetical protein